MRIPNLIGEHSRECLLVRAERRGSSVKVISALADGMLWKGVPEHIRSDNGSEFAAKDLRKCWRTQEQRHCIEPGSPWENGYCESFHSKLRDELLNGEIFLLHQRASRAGEPWRVYDNTVSPHSSLGYTPPALETWIILTGEPEYIDSYQIAASS